MSKYLITGAAGFIGSNLTEHLLNEGHTVIGLDNLSHGSKDNLKEALQNPNFTFIKGDITNSETCEEACKNCDYVLHQAALGSVPRSIELPHLYNSNNINGTFNMMMAAKNAGVKRFVYASSSSVYGDTPTLPKVESMIPRPKSPYAISKISNEYYGKVFSEVYGLPTIGLRYFNVFGPKQSPNSQYAAVIPKFITALLNNEAPTINGDGEQTRDFTFISNVIQANLNACHAKEPAFGKAFNIGCGSRISLNMLIESMKTTLASTVTPIYGPPRAGDVKDSLADINEAKTHLNFKDLVNLDKGLALTIEWFKSQ
jgi:UDP-N-acetylglucosamine 4-epimerase